MSYNTSMTNKEIFKSAIKKAIKNGWYINGEKVVGYSFYEGHYTFFVSFSLDKTDLSKFPDLEITKDSVFFRHDFAKAFWGEEDPFLTDSQGNVKRMMWQYHLVTMVLEEDSGKYLEKFLDPPTI